MRPSGHRVLRLATPVKVLAQRFALLLLVGVALAMIIVDSAEPVVTERFRTTIIDVVTPVLEFFARPASSIAETAEQIDSFFVVYEENAKLREENAHLKQWVTAARQLEQENEVLRDMLNVVSDPRASFVSARVIADSGGAFVRTILINAGVRDGVAPGQAVINGDGLLGRVVEAGRRSARVLLLTDLNSLIPVVIESTRERAILAGDNSGRPRLNFLSENAFVAPGERVVTSGHGGMFPPGLPIGIVSHVSEAEVQIQPFADWQRLEFVTVLNYFVPGVLPATRRAERIEGLR
ncbi:MAG: rod shape-determining protein MreC [Alphaproteobacteria bacterium]|nr:rod shape-determining protein MreC [Pseudomonadota bacterium]